MEKLSSNHSGIKLLTNRLIPRPLIESPKINSRAVNHFLGFFLLIALFSPPTLFGFGLVGLLVLLGINILSGVPSLWNLGSKDLV